MAPLSNRPKGTPNWIKFVDRFKTWKSLTRYKWDLIIVDYVPGMSYGDVCGAPSIDIVFVSAHKGYRLEPHNCVSPDHIHTCLVNEDIKLEISLAPTLLDKIRFCDAAVAVVTRCKTIPEVIEVMKRCIVLESL